MVDDIIPIKTEVHEHNKIYLDAKRDKMGHDLWFYLINASYHFT